jgi:mRNA interferase RelE/StbE
MRVELSAAAEKYLERLSGKAEALILQGLMGLKEEPPKGDIKKMHNGETEYRLRKGDYRILYDIDRERNIITVAKISPRGGAYK